MSLTRVLGRASRTTLSQCRSYFLSPPPLHRFHSLPNVSSKGSPLHNGLCSIVAFPHRGMSTTASPEQEQGIPAEKGDNGAKQTGEGFNADSETSAQSQEKGSTSESQPTSQGKRQSRGTKRTAFSDSDSEEDMDDLSKDLVKLVREKEKILENKQKEFAEFKDKFLRSYAELENLMERTRRDAENSKKFAVQSFAKNLLDVADNLGRAASVTRESVNEIDVSKDNVGAMPLLKTLQEGVEMTEKQLAEVFRKAGVEKYESIDEQFDPNRHNAVFQVPDNSKPPGTVAVVLKAGYTLNDRIIRPAEVGVTIAVENNEANS